MSVLINRQVYLHVKISQNQDYEVIAAHLITFRELMHCETASGRKKLLLCVHAKTDKELCVCVSRTVE